MNQMMGLQQPLFPAFLKIASIWPPRKSVDRLAGNDNITDSLNDVDPLASIAFRMVVEGLIDSEIMLILPLSVARDMVDGLLHSTAPTPMPQPAKPVTAPTMAAAPAATQQPYVAPSPPARGPAATMDQNVMVQPAQFAPLKQTVLNASDSNIGMIMDVPLQVTVELGRTRKLIREILELAPGSVVELDKLAGEPVDILVNGKIVAKGEVVVIDENFGVRITGIVSMQERASTLQ
jgi:flagellar motor switch protein FliN/FliY